MPPEAGRKLARWRHVQEKPIYWKNSLLKAEGRRIQWHSSAEPRSSQVLCISAFGSLRHVPDVDEILTRLLAGILSFDCRLGPWQLISEHSERSLLGEIGGGTPTCVDVLCTSPRAVVAIESKFLFDAYEGFGCCMQASTKQCVGLYGPASDLNPRTKGSSAANCRLAIDDGRRQARRYWNLGRTYFLDQVLNAQTKGETCPFAGPNIQLMRNLLFAAEAARLPRKKFAVLCVVPQKPSATVRNQISDFQGRILRDRYRARVGIATYDDLIRFLETSTVQTSRPLGSLLQERMKALL